MAEPRPSPSAGESPLEHRLVQVLLRAVQTVLRVRRVGAAEPVVLEAESALQSAFGPLWNWVQRVDLDVGRDTIGFGEREVLARDGDPEQLIDTLRQAGIRRLVLLPGVELEEIKVVLSVVAAHRRRQGSQGADLLTSLFRADLHRFQYEVDQAEVAAPQGSGVQPAPIEPAGPRPSAPPESVREAVRADVATAPESGVVRLEKFDSTLYFLDDREIDYLKSAIDREYSQDLALNALTLLLDVLEGRPEPTVRAEVIAILEDFLPALLGDGRFEAVASLVAGVREASQSAAQLTAEHKESLDRLRSSVSSREALSQLFYALEDGAVAPTAASMDVLLRELRPAAIREVLTWGVRLGDPTTRAAIVGALDTFFTQWPHGLSRMLNAPEREVVEAGLDLASRLKVAEFAEIVGEIATHADPRVRRKVAETLAALATAASLRRLLAMADDPDRDVRLVVYATFAARPTRGAFSTLKRAITGSDLEARGQTEKRTLFEAFGAVAGPEGVEVLEPLLRGRNPFGKRPSSHTRACAATGLGLIGTPAARSALEGFSGDRDPLVRSAVGAALKGEG